MLTYNTIYSYSTIFSCDIIVYWYTRIDLERKEKEEKKIKKERKRKYQTLSSQANNIYIQTGVSEIKRSGQFSRSEVITYTTSMRKRLRNEKKGILVDISII